MSACHMLPAIYVTFCIINYLYIIIPHFTQSANHLHFMKYNVLSAIISKFCSCYNDFCPVVAQQPRGLLTPTRFHTCHLQVQLNKSENDSLSYVT